MAIVKGQGKDQAGQDFIALTKEYYADVGIACQALPIASRIRMDQIVKKLESLDIDEGIRIESGDKKMFVNRSLSGTFLVQFGDSKELHYLDSAQQVLRLAKNLGTKLDVWTY